MPVTFIFSYVSHLLINTWSSKLIQPITTSLCVPCIATWNHLASSLWMNVIDFIFWLLHIYNLLTLFLLTPLCLPCMPSTDCSQLSIDYDNTFGDYSNLFANCAHNYNDCENIPNDWANIDVDLVNTLDISSLNLCIPNPAPFTDRK